MTLYKLVSYLTSPVFQAVSISLALVLQFSTVSLQARWSLLDLLSLTYFCWTELLNSSLLLLTNPKLRVVRWTIRGLF